MPRAARRCAALARHSGVAPSLARDLALRKESKAKAGADPAVSHLARGLALRQQGRGLDALVAWARAAEEPPPAAEGDGQGVDPCEPSAQQTDAAHDADGWEPGRE